MSSCASVNANANNFWDQLKAGPATTSPSGLTLLDDRISPNQNQNQNQNMHIPNLYVQPAVPTIPQKPQTVFEEHEQGGLLLRCVHFASVHVVASVSPEEKRFADQFPRQAELMKQATQSKLEEKEQALQEERLNRQRALFGHVVSGPTATTIPTKHRAHERF